MLRKTFTLFVGLFLLHCSGAGQSARSPIVKPLSIIISNETIITDGSNRMRLGYVLDEQSKSIAVFDVFDDKVIDTLDGDDWDRTPIPVGGSPVAMAVDEGVSPHQVWVVDASNNVLWGFEIAETQFTTKNDVFWNVLEIGTTQYSVTTQPLFFNSGATSQATLQNITLNNIPDGIESWELQHKGSQEFEVLGSNAGQQTERAGLSSTYTTDGNELSFLLQPGSRELSGSDRFYFSTLQGKPFELASTPVDMVILDRTLFVLTNGADSLILFDLDTQTITDTKALTLTSPTRLTVEDDVVYIVDGQTNQVEMYDIDGDSLSVTTFTDQASTATVFAKTLGDYIYILGLQDNRLIKWDVNAGETDDEIELSDIPNDITFFMQDDTQFALVPVQSGDVEIINIDTFSRVDTDTGKDADFNSLEFFDVGDGSNPELVSVGTFDNKTRSEQWQLVYQGVIPALSNIEVTITGAVVTFTDIDLNNTTLQVGEYIEVEDTLYEIDSIDSATQLTLVSVPTDTGAQTIHARSNDTYVAIGSKSGIQEARVERDVEYTSDDGEIALYIRSSLDNPVTTGDFFTFATVTGINPIRTNVRSQAHRTAVIQKVGQNNPTAYVLYRGSGALGRISLKNQELNKIIR